MIQTRLISAFMLWIAVFAVIGATDAAEVSLPNFTSFATVQRDSEGCWAAVIQMILNMNNIVWGQPDVLAAVKKRTTAADRANGPELAEKLSGKWTDLARNSFELRFERYPKPIPALIIGALRPGIQRPIILGLDGTHVVIVHAARFTAGLSSVDVTELTIFDPMEDRSMPLAWSEAMRRVTDMFVVVAFRAENRVF